MFKWLRKLFTKNNTEIPLFYVNFNLLKCKKYGKKNSCIAHIHPNFKNDEMVQEKINELIDYIRDNYDMGEM
jgi:hypothetical protein